MGLLSEICLNLAESALARVIWDFRFLVLHLLRLMGIFSVKWPDTGYFTTVMNIKRYIARRNPPYFFPSIRASLCSELISPFISCSPQLLVLSSRSFVLRETDSAAYSFAAVLLYGPKSGSHAAGSVRSVHRGTQWPQNFFFLPLNSHQVGRLTRERSTCDLHRTLNEEGNLDSPRIKRDPIVFSFSIFRDFSKRPEHFRVKKKDSRWGCRPRSHTGAKYDTCNTFSNFPF